jgi:hypothetical protein
VKYAIFSVILLACGCSLDVRGRSELVPAGKPGSMHDGTANGDSPDGGDSGSGIGKDSGTSGERDAGGTGASDSGSPAPMDAGGTTDTDAGNPGGNDMDSGGTGPVTDSGTSAGFTPAPGQVGAPCTGNGDCKGFSPTCAQSVDGSGMSGGKVDIPNGYCTHFCLNTAACGANESCQKSVCLRTCKTNDDCRIDDGFECRDKLCKLPGT